MAIVNINGNIIIIIICKDLSQNLNLTYPTILVTY